MATERMAKVKWAGSLIDGNGTIEGVGSGAFGPLDVTWASRAEAPDGRTSPEELLAAAWASCYSMALAHALAGDGTPPERLETSVTVTFQPGEGITAGAIHVVGTVSGIDHATFVARADDAKVNCPISMAVTGIPEVTVAATLATA